MTLSGDTATHSSKTAVTRPLRICHYVPGIRLEQGGVVRAILDWCTVLAVRGHQITLLAYQGNDIPREWLSHEPGNPSAKVLPPPLALPGKPLGRESLQIADQAIQQADLLHLHAPWLDGNRQLAAIARRRHVPYLVSLHGMLDDWSMSQREIKKRVYMVLWGRRFLDRAACVHCTAQAELAQSSKWFGNPRTAVLPYLVELKTFEELPGPEMGMEMIPPAHRAGPRLLFLSRLHEQKGIDILIRAAARLREKGTAFNLLLAGNGEPLYVRELQELVEKLHLSDRVVFLGLVTGQQKISLYQAADLFVLPTRHENFGLVLTEAMACGTPVVTTRGTDIWRELQQAGGVIAEMSPEGIAAAVAGLLARPQDLPALGERGRQWVFETLAVEPLAQRYEELYRQLAARGSPS